MFVFPLLLSLIVHECYSVLPGCSQVGQCRTRGDPHTWTFDGNRNDFQGHCKYLLIGAKDLNDDCWFAIEYKSVPDTRFGPKNGVQPTGMLLFDVITKSSRIRVLKFDMNTVTVNGKTETYPVTTDDLELRKVGHEYRLNHKTCKWGLQYANDNKNLKVYVELCRDKWFGNKVQGMCGNYDGNKDNDHNDANNKYVRNTDSFHWLGGYSFEVYDDTIYETCEVRGVERTVEADETISAVQIPTEDRLRLTKMCKKMGENEAFKSHCMEDETDKELIRRNVENCVNDFIKQGDTANDDDRMSYICSYMEEIGEICAEKYNKGINWRSYDFCPFQCENDEMMFFSRVVGCLKTCHDKQGTNCAEMEKVPREGCKCMSGMYLHHGRCLMENECGCYDKRYGELSIGDKVLSEDCETIIHCSGPNKIETLTNPKPCGFNAICNRQLNGEFDCECEKGFNGNPYRLCEDVVLEFHGKTGIIDDYRVHDHSSLIFDEEKDIKVPELEEFIQALVEENDDYTTTSYICDGTRAKLICPEDYWVHIYGVFYGRLTDNPETAKCVTRSLDKPAPCFSSTIHSSLQSRCTYKQNCLFQNNMQSFDAPCGNTTYDMVVKFVCLDYDVKEKIEQGLLEEKPTPATFPDPCLGDNNLDLVNKKICSISGDPHFRTFDGIYNHFQGVCKYTAARLIDESSECWFTMEVKQTEDHTLDSNGAFGSTLQAIDVRTHHEHIRITRSYTTFNGKNITVPETGEIQKGNFKISIVRSSYVSVKHICCGIQVIYNRLMNAYIMINEVYAEKVMGICGNANGDREDDKNDANGIMQGYLDPINWAGGDSFQVHDDTGIIDQYNPDIDCSVKSEQDVDKNLPPPLIPEEKDEIDELCEEMLKVVAFQVCGEKHNDLVVEKVNLCKMDIMALFRKGPALKQEEIKCSHAGNLADECAKTTGKIVEWRSEFFCPITCPQNSEYVPGIQNCPKTCDDPQGVACDPIILTLPGDQCVCKEGYLHFKDKCVLPSKCGCSQLNIGQLDVGQEALASDCQTIYTCVGHNDLRSRSSKTKCGTNAACVLNENKLFECQCNNGFAGNPNSACAIRTLIDDGIVGENSVTDEKINEIHDPLFTDQSAALDVYLWSLTAEVPAKSSGIVCPFDHLVIKCPKSSVIRIIGSFYGKPRLETGIAQCPLPKVNPPLNADDFPCSDPNALDVVQKKCDGSASCDIFVYNRIFHGSFCHRQGAVLVVKFQCIEETVEDLPQMANVRREEREEEQKMKEKEDEEEIKKNNGKVTKSKLCDGDHWINEFEFSDAKHIVKLTGEAIHDKWEKVADKLGQEIKKTKKNQKKKNNQKKNMIDATDSKRKENHEEKKVQNHHHQHNHGLLANLARHFFGRKKRSIAIPETDELKTIDDKMQELVEENHVENIEQTNLMDDDDDDDDDEEDTMKIMLTEKIAPPRFKRHLDIFKHLFNLPIFKKKEETKNTTKPKKKEKKKQKKKKQKKKKQNKPRNRNRSRNRRRRIRRLRMERKEKVGNKVRKHSALVAQRNTFVKNFLTRRLDVKVDKAKLALKAQCDMLSGEQMKLKIRDIMQVIKEKDKLKKNDKIKNLEKLEQLKDTLKDNLRKIRNDLKQRATLDEIENLQKLKNANPVQRHLLLLHEMKDVNVADKELYACTVKRTRRFETFDKREFEFIGDCKYSMAAVKEQYQDSCWFDVQIKRFNGDNGRKTLLADLVTLSHKIRLLSNTVSVNGQTISLPGTLDAHDFDNFITISRLLLTNKLTIENKVCGWKLVFKSDGFVQMSVTDHYKNRMTGICGNFDDEDNNDDFDSFGVKKDVNPQWNGGYSYEVPDDSGIDECERMGVELRRMGIEHNNLEDNMVKKTIKTGCDVHVKESFLNCQLEDGNLIKNNVKDCRSELEESLKKGDQIDIDDILCEYQKRTADDCANKNIKNVDIMKGNCRRICPTNAKYMRENNLCHKTCNDPSGMECGQAEKMMFDHCQADDGYLYEGVELVKKNECGCHHADYEVIKRDTIVLGKNCQTEIECTKNGELKERPATQTCSQNEQCMYTELNNYECAKNFENSMNEFGCNRDCGSDKVCYQLKNSRYLRSRDVFYKRLTQYLPLQSNKFEICIKDKFIGLKQRTIIAIYRRKVRRQNKWKLKNNIKSLATRKLPGVLQEIDICFDIFRCPRAATCFGVRVDKKLLNDVDSRLTKFYKYYLGKQLNNVLVPVCVKRRHIDQKLSVEKILTRFWRRWNRLNSWSTFEILLKDKDTSRQCDHNNCKSPLKCERLNFSMEIAGHISPVFQKYLKLKLKGKKDSIDFCYNKENLKKPYMAKIRSFWEEWLEHHGMAKWKKNLEKIHIALD
ncbi:hypothetical protein SNEBB_004340 [Seison nebaliae]|nr:hypothetical protein SNEBB_004340 [Seison nebaliae]